MNNYKEGRLKKMIVDIFMAIRVGLSNIDHRLVNCGFEH